MINRTLDEDEKNLWHKEAETVAPISTKKRVISSAPSKIVVSRQKRDEQLPLPSAYPYALSLGTYAGIDRNTANAFRKGKYPIDASLDLHGMSREQAHMALSGFVHAHYAMGNRCLLLICGKGIVLRESIPHWLDEPGLRPFILALDVAKGQHGGSGAYYILLRRRRA
jgi:DNA-nicking Smr family endonuclease